MIQGGKPNDSMSFFLETVEMKAHPEMDIPKDP